MKINSSASLLLAMFLLVAPNLRAQIVTYSFYFTAPDETCLTGSFVIDYGELPSCTEDFCMSIGPCEPIAGRYRIRLVDVDGEYGFNFRSQDNLLGVGEFTASFLFNLSPSPELLLNYNFPYGDLSFHESLLSIPGITSAFSCPAELCANIDVVIEKSKIHFHGDGKDYIDVSGQMTIPDGLLPLDFRDDSGMAAGQITVTVGDPAILAYVNESITFNVKDVNSNKDKEKWEFKGDDKEKISLQWKHHVKYDANQDPQVEALGFGKLHSNFIHSDETELQFDFDKATLPVTITVNDIELVTVDASAEVSSPFPIDEHGKKVDVLLPIRLTPGDVIIWTGGSCYSQTVSSGGFGATTVETYFSAGGKFKVRVPIEGVGFIDAPRTATVDLQLGSPSTAKACATLTVPMYELEGDEHWRFKDDDSE